jgi:hypothetical protein
MKRYESVYTEAYNVGLYLMDWLNQGLVDEVIIGLDDSAEFGLNVKGFNDLQSLSMQRGQRSVHFLHGADELSPLIIARHALSSIGALEDFTLCYLSEGQEDVLLPYEALPLRNTFWEKANYLTAPKLLRGAGSSDAKSGGSSGSVSSSSSDVGGNSGGSGSGGSGSGGSGSGGSGSRPSAKPKYIYVFTDQDSKTEQLQAAWQLIRTDKKRPHGALIGLVDAAKVNGSWAPLIESVRPDRLYRYVDAYAGWNTAGNSLGTVMAHLLFWEAAQRYSGQAKRMALAGHENLQKLRLIDDYFFQSIVRQDLITWATAEGFPYLSFGGRWMEANDKLSEMMRQALTAWPDLAPAWDPVQRGKASAWQYRFPWPRSFEIRVTQ